MKRLAVCLLALAACRPYAEFRLPIPSASDPRVTYTWEAQSDPVLSRGPGWEAIDVLNPSVIRVGPAQLFNFYSGFDGRTWHTGLATSADGRRWEKQGLVLSPDASTWEGSYIAANGSALACGDEICYWYEAGPRDRLAIGLARSRDGRSWRKHPSPVIEPGPYGSWDEVDVADPYVIRIEPYFYCYYLGQDRARRQQLGVARSKDGVRWEKLRSSPILKIGEAGAFDDDALGEPAVWQAHGFYWMLYTGRDRAGVRRLGLARANDGVHFEKLPAVFSGASDWNAKALCDPTVLVEGDTVRVWFGGGDAPRPDENLNGQIGYATLLPANATVGK